MSDAVRPDRPLDRFLALSEALFAEKRWFEDGSALRYAASTLVLHPGSVSRIAADLRRLAERLKQRTGWAGAMQSAARFPLAAMLLRAGDDAERFWDEVERLKPVYKRVGLRGSSSPTVLSMLLLRVHAERAGRTVGEGDVQRVRDIYAEMKTHHAFLTGAVDQPAAALLARSSETPGEIGRRLEVYYDGLRALGFRRGSALQAASHLLFFAPEAADQCMQRFRNLYDAFDQSGLWMGAGDYDEIASLCFVSRPASSVAGTALDHRARLGQIRPRPGKELSFSLACGTAFLQLAPLDALTEDLHGLRNVLQAQALQDAQQAAAAT